MVIDFVKIKKLREQINDLIRQRPELQVLQDEIDKELAKCGTNRHNRCVVIQNMMLTKWKEIVPMAEQLTDACKNLTENVAEAIEIQKEIDKAKNEKDT